MRFIKVNWDGYEYKFRLVDQEDGSKLTDGGVYVLLVYPNTTDNFAAPVVEDEELPVRSC